MVENKKTGTSEPSSAPPLPSKIAATLKPPESTEVVAKDDPVIDEAVDDITTEEADEVLAAEDAQIAQAFEAKKEPNGLKAKLANFFKAWWNNPKARYGAIAGVVLLLVVAISVPKSRYFVMNNVGIRSSASVMVIDESTQQPLKNVEVLVANQTGKTDSTGTVKLSHLKLGSTELVIKRRAFAGVTKKITVGWGSNPLGSFSLKPTGSQYEFRLIDFMSDKPIAKSEVNAGENNAVADDDGVAVLTVDQNEPSPLEITIKAEGYRDETMLLNLDEKASVSTKLVPSRKHSFVSKRSGKFDLYSIDVDGKNEKLLLAGTGAERDDIAIVPHPTKDVIALTSTRDNIRNKEGYLLSTLNIVNTKTGDKTSVTQSENIQLIDWIGNRLIFVQIAAGASGNNPNRMRLVSYDLDANVQKELASSNYFNDVVSAAGNIFYAPSETSSGNSLGFFRTNADGTGRINLLNKTTTNIFRSQYNLLTLSVDNEWYSYKLGDATVSKLSGPPASQQNRNYQDDEARKNSLWIDNRDGKGVLLRYDVASQEDTVLRTQSGLSSPSYWLNNGYVVYRINTDQETADYVLNLAGGQPRKISDVTNTTGLGNWYYY